jgi:hypothetical protein
MNVSITTKPCKREGYENNRITEYFISLIHLLLHLTKKEKDDHDHMFYKLCISLTMLLLFETSSDIQTA